MSPLLLLAAGVVESRRRDQQARGRGSYRHAGSPVEAVAGTIGDAAVKAFGLIGGSYQRMAEGTKTSSNSDEEQDAAFAAQLRRWDRVAMTCAVVTNRGTADVAMFSAAPTFTNVTCKPSSGTMLRCVESSRAWHRRTSATSASSEKDRCQ
ncbi:hypothetical protein [Nocardia nova]|nr:hypothetical protein [Nocardia nova]